MTSKSRPRVAIIDDEANIRETVSYALKKEKYQPLAFANGLEAWQAFKSKLPDLVIIDIIMPLMDGLELCRKLRQVSENLPIIFLTSKDEELDRILGLELGADDYICKPFSMRELMVRVKVLFRRRNMSNENQGQEQIHKIGELELDLNRYMVQWKKEEVPLTITEFMLLKSLIQNPGYVKTREQLMQEAYPDNIYVSDRTIDSHIKRLRKKISSIDKSFARIETVYGLGYRYKA
jgi:two-component system response regulator ChvI